MIDTLKKALLAGVGAAVVTKEKVEAGLEEFVKQGKLGAKDAQEIAEKIASEGRREFDATWSTLSEKLRDLLSSFESKHAARIDALERRVQALEEKTPKQPARHTKS